MVPPRPEDLTVELFADGADIASIVELYKNPLITGFTTNPTLMNKVGITDYPAFARELLAAVPDRPISFEVFADDVDEIERQARLIATWGDNVYVKLPITTTDGTHLGTLAEKLAADGIQLNLTALMTVDQVRSVVGALSNGPSAFVSVFAGRIADTGRDPMPIMREALEVLAPHPHVRLIWASPRELLNVFQANEIGCHVITATPDVLAKLALVGKDLDQFSLETVAMFRDDAVASGFTL